MHPFWMSKNTKEYKQKTQNVIKPAYYVYHLFEGFWKSEEEQDENCKYKFRGVKGFNINGEKINSQNVYSSTFTLDNFSFALIFTDVV